MLTQKKRFDLGLLLLQLGLHGLHFRHGLLLLQLSDDAPALQLASLTLNQCWNLFDCFLVKLEGLLTDELALSLLLRSGRRAIAWLEDDMVLHEMAYKRQVEDLISISESQMLSQRIHLLTELGVLGMLHQYLIKYLLAFPFWRGVHPLHDRDICLLWEVDVSNETEMQEMRSRQA